MSIIQAVVAPVPEPNQTKQEEVAVSSVPDAAQNLALGTDIDQSELHELLQPTPEQPPLDANPPILHSEEVLTYTQTANLYAIPAQETSRRTSSDITSSAGQEDHIKPTPEISRSPNMSQVAAVPGTVSPSAQLPRNTPVTLGSTPISPSQNLSASGVNPLLPKANEAQSLPANGQHVLPGSSRSNGAAERKTVDMEQQPPEQIPRLEKLKRDDIIHELRKLGQIVSAPTSNYQECDD